eukprot:2882308-Alexandrium_andersonii.AAC.1
MADAVADDFHHPMIDRLRGVGIGQHAQKGLLDLLQQRTAILDDIRAIHGALGGAAKYILLPSAIPSAASSQLPGRVCSSPWC